MDDRFEEGPEKRPKLPVERQVSAGGVIFRRHGATSEIAIVLVNPGRRWQLPKGIVDDGETLETAALREVCEETGIEGLLLAPVETIEYWYVGDRHGVKTKYHKFVHFFLLAARGGEILAHGDGGDEIAAARWVSVAAALDMLAFKSERGVVIKAASLFETSQS